ncbi:RNA-dependent ATPase rok1, partial [Massospora cicadina]
ALVVSPTRELAQQIHSQFQRLAAGTKFRIQYLTKATAAALNQPAEFRPKFDVLVTTPLRLVHAIKEAKIDLTKVTQLVLDEADKLFEMGFVEQVDAIVAACTSPVLRKALFSATIPSGVEKLASSIMNDTIRVVHGTKDGATELIQQELVYAGQESGKLMALRNLIRKGFLPPAIIFVQSVERAQQLYLELVYDNLHVDVIHSERPQRQREAVIARFRQGEVWILIATDILARGLDFRGVNLVINYDFPQTVQSYIHRIGRTGRAGRPGRAVTFFTDVDAEYLRSVANVMVQSGCSVPDWMLKLKKPSQDARKKLKRAPTEREDILAQPKAVLREQRKKR